MYDDNLSLQEYLQLLEEVFSNAIVFSPGGRMVVNVANLGRKPYIPLSTYINNIMFNLGFLMRGEIIWINQRVLGHRVLGVRSRVHQIHVCETFTNTC